MGGYFLTNSKKNTDKKKILESFNAKGMKDFNEIKLGDYTCFYFNKIYLKDKINHIYKKNEDYVIGVGTFFYKGKYGYEALRLIYNDYNIKIDNKYNSFRDEIFNKILGHFNLIIYIDGILKIVTDKTGTYHSFKLENNDKKYFSTSILALTKLTKKLSLSKQESLEFINREATLCGDTIFKEISYIDFGNVLNLKKDKLIYKNYFKEFEVDNVSIDYIYENIINQISFLKDIDLNISVELSAGYDSRTVAAIFKKLRIPHEFNTNHNSTDGLDHKIAVRIARNEGKKISIIQKRMKEFKYKNLVNKNFNILETSRDIFRSAYSPVFLKEKSSLAHLIVGGYGGELYRDSKYKGVNDIYDIINNSYTSFSFKSEKEKIKYQNKLIEKFKNHQQINIKNFNDEQIARIYYFIKMMYWGGSRISAFNQYTYRFHPLLDYNLIYPLFYISKEEKKYGKLQMKIIELFDYNLSKYSSDYLYNFNWYHFKYLEIILKNYVNKFRKKYNEIKSKSNKMYYNEKLLNDDFDLEKVKIGFLNRSIDYDNFPDKLISRINTLKFFAKRML